MGQITKSKKQFDQKEEEQYKQLIKNSPVGLFETDADGKFLFVNKKWCEITGFSEEEALNLSFVDLVFEKDQERILLELSDSAHEISKFESTFRILKADESIQWVKGIANALVDQWRYFKGFSGVIEETVRSDKSEKILKEEYRQYEKIKDKERQLSEAQRIGNIGSWEWDLEKNYISWTEQLYRIFEIEPGTPITLNTYFNKIHPEDLNFVKNLIFVAKKRRRSFNFQHRIMVKDNVIKYLHCKGSVIRADDFEPVIMQGTAEDITDDWIKEENERNKKLQTINFQSTLLELSKISGLSLKLVYERITETDALQIDTERVGIWLFNESRTAVICYCLYTKSTHKHSFDITILKRDAPYYFSALEDNRVIVANDAINDPATSDLNNFYLKPIGVTSMLDAPIRVQGKLLGVVCHEHVGPKRKWTDEEQNFAASVAEIVAIYIEAHNLRKTEKELNVLNEKLEMANEHKSQFISVISHDLRNPISSIISASSFLVDHFDELAIAETRHMIKIINKSSKEVLLQFDELVRIAKKENHSNLFYPEKLPLFKEVNKALKLVFQVAEQKKIIIHNKIKEGIYISADKIMLRSILQNLLTNAIKFSYEGEEIDIYSKTVNNMERITIRDRGFGMSKKKQRNLFSDVQSVESKKGTLGETGAGLGLRIVKDFVEKHNGIIEVESEEGKGTSISFTMPIAI